MKVVYVTGCLGFIGSYITRTCLEKGWYVRGIDKMTYASNPNLLNEFNKYDNFIFENKDINDIEFLYECDYIINTAAETHVGNSIVKSEDFLHSNVNGVHNLLELIRNYRAETDKLPILLHFSTDEVYGDITKGEHIETDILNPSNPYSATKAAADQLILAWARTYKLPYVILRPTNNYGIGQYTEKLIPKSIKYLGLGKKIPLHNDGEPIRNWLHAQDTADAVITIIERPYHVRDEIYNICGGFEQSNLTTVKKIIELYHPEDEDLADKFPHYPQRRVFEYIDFDYSRQGQDIRYALNDDKLRKLGWKPKKIFDDELPAIVEYYQNNFIW
jgi:dTDP-glucose 4,6-dehydratase|tara:strand:+ start:63 stop:1055 length:993 start_codon:yes stop_codon:yes gene_type:complete